MALGNSVAGFYCNDDNLKMQIMNASKVLYIYVHLAI
jgi:leucyl aminopeptidase